MVESPCASFFGFAAGVVLAPETRAVLAGKKARAVRAQRAGIWPSKWEGIVCMCIYYLLLATLTIKANSGCAAFAFWSAA